MPKHNVQGNLYVISGPSGVGKDTLVVRLFNMLPELKSSVSVTSRPPRNGEIDSVHYFFLPFNKIQQMINNDELIEWNEYAGNLYGTPRKFVEDTLASGQDILFSVDVHGAINIKRHFPEAKLIFIAPPSIKELRSRLEQRASENSQQIDLRLEIAEDELSYKPKFDFCIINDNLEKALQEIVDIIS